MILEKRIADIVQPVLEDMGYDLVRVQISGGEEAMVVQIMIEHLDETKQITVDDCENASNAVSVILDVEDPINGMYQLEMSSPGIDRPLTRLKDFVKYTGLEAKIELDDPLAERKRFRGILGGVENETDIRITVDGVDYALPFAKLGRAKLVMNDELMAFMKGRH